MFILKNRSAALVAAALGLGTHLVVPVTAQPLRYEVCTTGFSTEGIIDDLPVYDGEGEQVATTEDLLMTRQGEVRTLVIHTDGLLTADRAFVPWTQVEIGETWVRALGRVDAALAERPDGLVAASGLIGSIVRTSEAGGLTPFGVVDDLLIDVDSVMAVVVRPDLGLNFDGRYAVPFNLNFLDDWNEAQPRLDLSFDQDEVRDIGAFDC